MKKHLLRLFIIGMPALVVFALGIELCSFGGTAKYVGWFFIISGVSPLIVYFMNRVYLSFGSPYIRVHKYLWINGRASIPEVVQALRVRPSTVKNVFEDVGRMNLKEFRHKSDLIHFCRMMSQRGYREIYDKKSHLHKQIYRHMYVYGSFTPSHLGSILGVSIEAVLSALQTLQCENLAHISDVCADSPYFNVWKPGPA